MRKIYLSILSMSVALAACGQASPQSTQSNLDPNTSTATSVSTSAPVTAEPAEQATADVGELISPVAEETPASAGEQPADRQPGQALLTAARQQLATHLKVAPEKVTLQNVEPQEWSDGSLGCPDPATMYPQVITPGYLLMFSDGATTYEVHTGESENFMVLCDNQQPVELSGETSESEAVSETTAPAQIAKQPALVPTAEPGESATLDETSRPMVEKAQQALAKELNIGADQVKLVKLESMEWSDGSLGCPKPDTMYLQVITPGYKISLDAQGKVYTYHTDMERQVVRCDA